jgi:translation initiation factor 5
MSMINVNKSEDPFYRYKMEKVRVNNCGFGNGQYTIINNLDNISKSINTPTDILIKHLILTMGSSYNEKKKSFTGTHSDEKIQEHIYEYINKYVICSNCNIPELTYIIQNKNLESICSSCGHNKNIIINNKVTESIEKYIIKNKGWIKIKGNMVNLNQNIINDFNPF